MNESAKQNPEIPLTAQQCWVHAFTRCKLNLRSVAVYLDRIRWFDLASQSSVSFDSARLCADQGIARIQVLKGETWELDNATVVTFHILAHWTPDQMIIVAVE